MPVEERRNALKDLLNRSLSDPPASAEEAAPRLRAAEFRSEGSASSGHARAGSDSGTFNPWVYVPAHPVIKDGAELAEYELRELADGNKVLPVFTSAEKLIEQLGMAQPWLKVRLYRVIELIGRDRVAVDPVIDPAGWRWDSKELRKFSETLKGDRGRS